MEKETIPGGERLENPNLGKRFRDLELQGFTNHLFDTGVENHQKQLTALYEEAKDKGWQIETIHEGKYTYVFTKES